MADKDKPWLDMPIIRAAPTAAENNEPAPTGSGGVARNVAAGGVEGGTSLLNMATDPFGTVIGPTIARVGGTLWDAGAHLTGLYPAMTEEQRRDLYGQNPVEPAQQPIATRVVNAVDAAIPGPKAADVTADTPGEQIARKVTGAAVAGGVGGVGPGLVAGGGAAAGDVASRVVPDWLAPGAELVGNVAGSKVASRVVSPVRTVTTPERQRLVEVLDTEGVPLTAGERTGSKPLMKTEQMLGQTPGSAGGVAEDLATKERAVNRAVASRTGLNSDTLTHDVLNTHLDGLGTEIGQLASNNNMQINAPFAQTLGQLRARLPDMKTEVRQEIEARLGQMNRMITVDASGNAVVPGTSFQNLVSDLRDAIKGATGTAQTELIRFRDTLRQQMEASMNPADAARWRELNRLYANGMVIQDAMGAAGAGTAEGNISLLQLRGAIKNSMGKDAYARGYGDLNDLARAGQSVLRKPPDSGSPQGIAINALLKGVPLATGGAGSYLGPQFGLGGLESFAAGMATPWAVGAAMRGRIPGTNYSPGQSYLGNRAAIYNNPRINELARYIDPATIAALAAENEERQRNRLMNR